ncbi:DUF397 domain-containing protein [Streptomyces sp. SDr-06]|uniref:DUF397 domain-containing protein n=1 Tax=Streptomyces sp. SDr-06 TaxID=2267702 RepID=UPI000DEA38C7|nr:DUF397 domain-containing protein [Streptomyces sp. SDr-06]RCH68741.1 DUF397 domain-containing protein [Streptomyces sp. SDr-06]
MTTDSPQWVKSSYSGNGGQCVEAALNLASTGVVPVRDSKQPEGPSLMLAPQAFAGLVQFAKQA